MRKLTAFGLATILALSAPVYGKAKAAQKVNKDQFERLILSGDRPTLVTFYTRWDRGSNAYLETFEKFCADHAVQVRCGVVDVDAETDLSEKPDVFTSAKLSALATLPTTVVYLAGKELKRAPKASTYGELDAAYKASSGKTDKSE